MAPSKNSRPLPRPTVLLGPPATKPSKTEKLSRPSTTTSWRRSTTLSSAIPPLPLTPRTAASSKSVSTTLRRTPSTSSVTLPPLTSRAIAELATPASRPTSPSPITTRTAMAPMKSKSSIRTTTLLFIRITLSATSSQTSTRRPWSRTTSSPTTTLP